MAFSGADVVQTEGSVGARERLTTGHGSRVCGSQGAGFPPVCLGVVEVEVGSGLAVGIFPGGLVFADRSRVGWRGRGARGVLGSGTSLPWTHVLPLHAWLGGALAPMLHADRPRGILQWGWPALVRSEKSAEGTQRLHAARAGVPELVVGLNVRRAQRHPSKLP